MNQIILFITKPWPRSEAMAILLLKILEDLQKNYFVLAVGNILDNFVVVDTKAAGASAFHKMLQQIQQRHTS